MRTIVPLALALIATGAAARQGTTDMRAGMPQPACTAPAALPAAYASFAHPVPAAEGGGVFVGQAATLDLGPGMHFAVAPEHHPADGTFGGTVGFDVNDPGTYRVAIGAGVWVDVIRQDAAVRSVAHDHGPACTAVRKIVDFALTPGHYTLQFSGSTVPRVTFMVLKPS